jgi:phosphonate transport system substrate-binding protein
LTRSTISRRTTRLARSTRASSRGEGAEAERQRAVLAGLNYSRFNAADDSYLNPVREMVADQQLIAARARGDAAAAATAERELQRLRSLREVQP